MIKIRAFIAEDLDTVMEIWLQANLDAHSFISSSYWKENYNFVKEALPKAAIYICESQGEITGFIGLIETHIAGFFIKKEYHSKGMGKQLLQFVQEKHSKLSLNVYLKNKKAIYFYKKNQFKIIETQEDTEEKEVKYVMLWEKSI